MRHLILVLSTIVALVLSTSALAAVPLKPNPAITPGAINASVPLSLMCKRGYTAEAGVRKVTAATKKKVFAEYGIDPKSGSFEVDHLISLELGGSNDIKNLWPQSYTSTPLNAHVKDALEDHLHALVCAGKVPLAQAQHDIALDWVAAHTKYMAMK